MKTIKAKPCLLAALETGNLFRFNTRTFKVTATYPAAVYATRQDNESKYKFPVATLVTHLIERI